mmetsp:Transcript_81994/g.163808  ORF Transcript_81994/g.163808 Transcript_81994/m.163808 type:complete len:202 (+) Transcript_81994:466-1071(+)
MDKRVSFDKSAGRGPVNLLNDSRSVFRLEQLNNPSGRAWLMVLLLRLREVSASKVDTVYGISPQSLFPLKFKLLSPAAAPLLALLRFRFMPSKNRAGRGPVIWLLLRSRVARLVKVDHAGGRGPVIWLLGSDKAFNLSSHRISSTNGPCKLFFGRTMLDTRWSCVLRVCTPNHAKWDPGGLLACRASFHPFLRPHPCPAVW